MRASRTPIILTTVNVALTAVLATLIAFSYWSGRSSQRTESLQILDAEGNPRIVLAVDDEVPTLRMIDQHGRVRIEFEVRPFWDVLDNRDELASYAVPTIALLHANGEQGLDLELANGDLPWLNMHDDQFNDVVSLGLNSYEAPSLEMSDAAYKRHVGIRFDDKGYYGFAAYDPDFDDLLRVGVTSDGSPALQLYGIDEQQRAALEMATDRPRLGFWTANGVLVKNVAPDSTGD